MAKDQKYEVYENAPIVVAILQFRYKKLEEFNSKNIREVGSKIKSKFPNISDSVLQNFRLDREGETKFSLDSQEINGVKFESEDNKKILVIGTDKFTYEIHGKYSGWENFKTEAKDLWQLFNPHLTGLEISGVSMRYINRIDLPIETKDVSQYITTYIHSNTGNHNINQFQIRYSSIDEDNLQIHVGHALEPAIENKIPYFLDIDVISLKEIQNEEKVIWDEFETLRNKKNLTFNDLITENTKKLIR
jgi:uncharacterized protein (TIGR04255 family)